MCVYRTDLAPSDYHLILHLKQWVQSQLFESDEELMTGVTNWLKFIFFYAGLKKLVQRCKKCVEVGGDYVKK